MYRVRLQRRIGYAIVVLMLTAPAMPGARGTLSVCASGCQFSDLQSALWTAASGDTIVLTPGETYVGDFELPSTRHTTPVRITSSAGCPDRRLTPADAGHLPVVRALSMDTPAIAGFGAAGWELACLRFEPSTRGSYNVVQFTNVRLADGSIRHNDSIVLDRIYIAPGEANVQKAIHADGGNITLSRSHIENVRRAYAETKGFGMQEGPGPVTIRDNYIEAASINILFGGGDTPRGEYVPKQILIEGNHLAKRPEWEGGIYMPKNLLELKAATSVTVRNNLLDGGWWGGEDIGILLQPVNDTWNSPWNRITDVLFTGNIVRRVARGIAILGYEWQPCCNSGQTARITLTNNLFVTAGRFLYASGEIDDVTIDHNTIDNNGVNGDAPGPGAYLQNGEVSTPTGYRAGAYAIDHFVFTNNLMKKGQHGWAGLGHPEAEVTALIESTTNSYLWFNNIIAGVVGHTYPNCGGAFECFPSVAEHNAQFNADYTLVAGSRYRNAATDGADLGWGGAWSGGGGSGTPDSGGGSGAGGGDQGPGATTVFPGTLQVEDFDAGGPGVAYADADAGNNGGAYRAGDVDISGTGDAGGGYAVGWAGSGEWLKYSVGVSAAGRYDISVRVAHASHGGTFHLEVNGTDVTGQMTVPATGGWDTWTTVTTRGVHLNAGQQVWRLVMDSGGDFSATGNFNWIAVAPSSEAPPPSGGTGIALPGTLQVEDFDAGNQGTTYWDADGGNNGGEYRPGDDVDIAATSDAGGGYVVGWAGRGEWLQYTVTLSAAGTYDISVRVAHAGAGGTFHIEVDGVDVTGAMAVPATGWWDTWTTVTKTGVRLNAGRQVWRLVMDTNGDWEATGNFNWIAVHPR